jgi:predicted ATPase
VAYLSWAAWDLWFLGRPDQASDKSREAIALSRELAHPFSSVFALGVSALLHLIMRDTKIAGALVEETTKIAAEHNFPFWLVQITFMRGWLSVLDGRIIEGIDMMREGMSTYQIIGCEDTRSMLLTIYADALSLANRPNDCQKVLDEAVEFVENTGERFYEAELYRVRGELLLRQNDFNAAEASFRKAILITRQQGALSWELRASSSLCKLLIGLGRLEEAHLVLSAIISQFDPSLDTPDLAEARTLLR